MFRYQFQWHSTNLISPVLLLVGTILCPVLWNMRTQDRKLEVSQICPQNPSKSWTLSKTHLPLYYIFYACAWFEKVWKCTKKWKVPDFLDDCWCMGGYIHKGFVKLVFKCLDRTHCLCDLRLFCHVQDMSRTFPTKTIHWNEHDRWCHFLVFMVTLDIVCFVQTCLSIESICNHQFRHDWNHILLVFTWRIEFSCSLLKRFDFLCNKLKFSDSKILIKDTEHILFFSNLFWYQITWESIFHFLVSQNSSLNPKPCILHLFIISLLKFLSYFDCIIFGTVQERMSPKILVLLLFLFVIYIV